MEKLTKMNTYRVTKHLTHFRSEYGFKGTVYCDLKVSGSQAKIYENFTNYFLKHKANNKCFILLKCTCTGLPKSIGDLGR